MGNVRTKKARCSRAPRSSSLPIPHSPFPIAEADPPARYQAGRTIEARNSIAERDLPLVKFKAQWVIGSRLLEGVELDDLEAAGVFGLLDAIAAFDVERGVKFATYCVPPIRGSILDELRKMDWVPRLVCCSAHRLKDAVARLPAARRARSDGRRAGGRAGDHAGPIGTADVRGQYRGDRQPAQGLVRDGQPEGRVLRLTESTIWTVAEPSRRLEAQDELRERGGCSTTERLILIGYYCEDDTMKEVGASLGMSESRVSQIHSAR